MPMRQKDWHKITAPLNRQEVGKTGRAEGVGQIIAAEYYYGCSSWRLEDKNPPPAVCDTESAIYFSFFSS